MKKLIDKVLEVLDSKYAENFAVAIMFISQLIIVTFCVKFVFLVFKALEKYIGA